MSDQQATERPSSASAVRALYEHYPYPSPISGHTLIEDVANGIFSVFGERSLAGWRILDAGCGSGHRLMGMARRYPEAEFIGVDMTSASLEVAERLARRHGIANVRLVQDDLLNLSSIGKFDLIVSTGVIVCLENPQQGLRKLASLLAPHGMLMVWLYGAEGEHQRMRDRELLHYLWDRDSGLQSGVQIMRELGLHLAAEQYGGDSSHQGEEISSLSIDVDAFIHPIVNVYRFDEAIDMFGQCSELAWAAINSLNVVGASKLVDLQEAEQAELRHFCASVDELFKTESLRQRFRQLPTLQKLRVLELKLRPTGFTILGGGDSAYATLGPRIIGNTVELARMRG
jgi:SAM-dependent methyltransferase